MIIAGYPLDDVIQSVRVADGMVDGSVSGNQYDDLRRDGEIDGPSAGSIRRICGWNNLKDRAGLSTNHVTGKAGEYTRNETIESVARADRLVDGGMSRAQYDEMIHNGVVSGPCSVTVHNKFGWSDLKEEMGLKESDENRTEKSIQQRADNQSEGARYSVPVHFYDTPSDTVGSIYEIASMNHRDFGSKHVKIHRLQMVAYEGFDAVEGKVVHHKSKHGLDNRPENLELMTAAEHTRLHQNE